MVDLHGDVETRGFSIVEGLLDREQVDRLIDALNVTEKDEAVRKREGVYAIRNLLDIVPAVASLAESEKLMSLAQSALGKRAFPVRGTLFDKTPGANWLVPWHQDLTICVKQRIEVEGYGPWTMKAGVPHVQPPADVLDSMVAVRIHLDDCHERNGALRVWPFTHRDGRLATEQIELAQKNSKPVVCAVKCGGAVLMKPLTLHASSAADEPSHRRVIHIDYASCVLPGGLQWFREQ